MGKEIRVNVRIAEELKAGVQRVYDVTGVDESTLVRAALESIVEYFDEHGEITLPLVTVPKSAWKKKQKASRTPELPSEDVPAAGSRSSVSTRRYPEAHESFGKRDIGLVAENREKEKH